MGHIRSKPLHTYRKFWPLAFAALLLALSFVPWGGSADERLQANGDQLQRQVASASVQLEQHADHLAEHLLTTSTSDLFQQHSDDLASEWQQEGLLTLAVVGDKVEFWSGQGPAIRADLPFAKGVSSLSIRDGIYLHTSRQVGHRVLHCLRKVWSSPAYENRYITAGFHPSLKATTGISASLSGGIGPVVRTPKDQVLFRLIWASEKDRYAPSSWVMLLRVLGLLLLIAGLWRWCRSFISRAGPAAGIITFLALLVLIRLASFTLLDDSYELFDPTLYAASATLPSLGDLIITAALILIAAAFIHTVINSTTFRDLAAPIRMVIWATLLFLFGGWISQVLIGLVENSSIDLDLYHVQHLTPYSVAAMLAAAMLLGSWVLLAHAMIRDQFSDGSRQNSPWFILLFASIISVIVHHQAGFLDTALMLWPVPIILVMAFAQRRGQRFGMVLVILGTCSALAAHVLNKQVNNREERERIVLAEKLAANDDPVAELLFLDEVQRVLHDEEIAQLLANEGPCSLSDIDQLLRTSHFTASYWERYGLKVHPFTAEEEPSCREGSEVSSSWNDLWELFSNAPASNAAPDLRLADKPGSDLVYLALMPVERHDAPGLAGYLFIELEPRSAPEELGFPELLLAGVDPMDDRLQRYDQARYRNGLLMQQFGDHAYPLRWKGEELSGGRWYEDTELKHLAYGADDDVVVLSTHKPTPLDQITTFSYLFAFFSVLAVIALTFLLITKHKGLPPMDLRIKVRIALVLFTLIGLVMFGLGARTLLVRSANERENATIEEKTHSVLIELQQKLSAEASLEPKVGPYLDHLLSKFSKVFFTDITLYDPYGKLLSTSRPQVFAADLLGRYMDPKAYERLAIGGMSEFVHLEQIGSLSYRSAYAPFLNDDDRVLAYVNLPYFARQNELERERSGLLVAIVNLFVLLFALSMLAAIFISNWTTRPLELLQRAVSRMDLEGSNEPLPFSSSGEIGKLVTIYNQKVDDLRESAERLARSERESAWREMARQVAHEIKNPLTPMKLSIQHFERSWSPEADNADQKLASFTSGLIDQIEALSRIAGEFSNFAQMPKAREQELDLCSVVNASIEVFKGTENVEIRMASAPDDPLMVMADKEHLLRVFNNLIKNATQAIPDDIEGHVDVTIRQKNGSAIVDVKDNGEGVPLEIQERIFVPNFTTRGTGMGLGLAMVKRIVESAHGTVSFKSKEGFGTTFTVRLPVHE